MSRQGVLKGIIHGCWLPGASGGGEGPVRGGAVASCSSVELIRKKGNRPLANEHMCSYSVCNCGMDTRD